MDVADLGATRAQWSTGCSGFCALALPGKICRIAIRPIGPVIAAFSTGSFWLLLQLLQRLAEDSRDRGNLDRSEAFVDDSFSSAKKGAPPSASLDAVRAAKIMNNQGQCLVGFKRHNGIARVRYCGVVSFLPRTVTSPPGPCSIGRSIHLHTNYNKI
jgi:hypothetical protein